VFSIGSTAVSPPQAPNTGISKLVVNLSFVAETITLGVIFSPLPLDSDAAVPAVASQPLWQWRAWARGLRQTRR
jgi:hypothetical protein